jgi:hypothetical protein
MSKPITGCLADASYVVRAYPTTPPAGPERMAREPIKLSTDVRPPSDCMKRTARSFSRASKPALNADT